MSINFKWNLEKNTLLKKESDEPCSNVRASVTIASGAGYEIV